MVRKNPKRKQTLANSGIRGRLEKMNYGLVGNHSAVQICRWTKSAVRGKSPCWKEKFYGITTAGCVQMSPSVLWCEHNCIHCWRPLEMYKGSNLEGDVGKLEDPREILDGIIKKRKELLMGFKGNSEVKDSEFEELIEPKLYTMSLSGEATLYPKLGEMFKEIRKRGAVSFLVTNGQNPEVIREMAKDGKKELPTQLVLSTNAPNERLFDLWHKSRNKEAWKKFNESVDLMKKLKGKVRRVIRLTLVRNKEGGGRSGKLSNMNEENLGEYVKIILRAEPDLIHVKGFKSVGFSRSRLAYDKQPWFNEIKDYVSKLVKELNKTDRGKKLGYEIKGSVENSCVIMLARNGFKLKIEEV